MAQTLWGKKKNHVLNTFSWFGAHTSYRLLCNRLQIVSQSTQSDVQYLYDTHEPYVYMEPAKPGGLERRMKARSQKTWISTIVYLSACHGGIRSSFVSLEEEGIFVGSLSNEASRSTLFVESRARACIYDNKCHGDVCSQSLGWNKNLSLGFRSTTSLSYPSQISNRALGAGGGAEGLALDQPLSKK